MILLAPLQGYTDFIFRNVYARHYTGLDVAVSPYISLINGIKGYPLLAKDVLPVNNTSMPVIPQVIGNDPEYFIQMAAVLYDWGYNRLNWNMGCPIRSTVNKKKGAGLLPFPALVRDILEKTLPHIQGKLSIKLRLGYHSTAEIYQMIPVLNDFPLECIIIHPRTGRQMYEGEIHHDVLEDCLPLIRHKVVYNGDIVSLRDFNNIKTRYPSISQWMIGRGIFANPLLPAAIKGEAPISETDARKRLLSLILELYEASRPYRNEEQLVSKAKNFWKLFSLGFSNPAHVFGLIAHASSMAEIIPLTERIIHEQMLAGN